MCVRLLPELYVGAVNMEGRIDYIPICVCVCARVYVCENTMCVQLN